MRFLFLVEGILRFPNYRHYFPRTISRNNVGRIIRVARFRENAFGKVSPFIRPTFARYRRSIGRTIVDRFSPQLRRDEDRGCRSGREEERKGKERREGRFSTSVRRIRRGGPVMQSRAKGKGERFTIEFDSSPWKNLISV